MTRVRKDGYVMRPVREPLQSQCLNCSSALLTKRTVPKKFCGVKCRVQWGKFNEEPNATCEQCARPFWIYPHVLTESHKGNTAGRFCSTACYVESKAGKVPLTKTGEKIGKVAEEGTLRLGYLLAPEGMRTKYPSEHSRIVCEYLDTDFIPRGLHIHHRDLDKTNNELSNLSILNGSDHHWLHFKAGDFGLKEFAAGNCTAELIARTCEEPERLIKLINKCVLTQSLEDINNFDP